jgi:hypothetical protein
MDYESAIKLLQSGQVEDWNQQYLADSAVKPPDLKGVDLHGADLRGVFLYRARLFDVNFEGANLQSAVLQYAEFLGTNLRSANLEKADLACTLVVNSNLSGANLRESYLFAAILRDSELGDVDFAGSWVGATTWGNVDLSHAKGLECLKHQNSSTIGLDTLLKSGELPDEFLLGCGIPETILPTVRSLHNYVQPIQFYTCFISYSHKDQEFTQRLHGRLRQEGLRIWYAAEDIKAGKKIHHQIDDAIRLHDKLLLVLSEASMNSEWVATEICKARKRESQEGQQVLFPIRLVDFERINAWERFDADSGKDMAREIREYFISDFSAWKDHDSFESAFARLLSDLKKSVESGTK